MRERSGFNLGFPKKSLVRAEGFKHCRGLEAFAVIDAHPRLASAALQAGSPEQQKRSDFRHYFGSEPDFADVRQPRPRPLSIFDRPSGTLAPVVFDADPDVK